MYSGYLWIPVRFDEEGMPYLTQKYLPLLFDVF